MKYEFIGSSYKKRVIDVNRIYDEHSKEGLTNREIFRKFIYPLINNFKNKVLPKIPRLIQIITAIILCIGISVDFILSCIKYLQF